MSLDKRELFATQMKAHMERLTAQLAASLSKDKMMTTLDAVALESIRLQIPGWDQMTLAALREEIRTRRAAERDALSSASCLTMGTLKEMK